MFTHVYNISDWNGPYDSLVLNLQDSLPGVTVTPLSQTINVSTDKTVVSPLAFEGGQVVLDLWVAPAEAASTVCETGEHYGPFNITINQSSQASTVTPPEGEATQTTLNVINIGSFFMCVKVTSTVSIEAELNYLGLQVGKCASSPAAIAGTWVGTYSCTGNCPEGPLPIELYTIQDPENPALATYTDDLGGDFSGTICGNRFTFRGGSTSYSESGTFILESPTTATKTSTYREFFPGFCYGTCTDNLTRLDGS
jgi:hypothetical protein